MMRGSAPTRVVHFDLYSPFSIKLNVNSTPPKDVPVSEFTQPEEGK